MRSAGAVGASLSNPDHRHLVPLTTMSTRRLPHREHTSRSRQSGTGVSALYRSGIFCRIGFNPMSAIPTPND
jgi:hypothetical protein